VCHGSDNEEIVCFVAQGCRRGCGRPAALSSGHQKSAGPAQTAWPRATN